jgi:hypothetical protein
MTPETLQRINDLRQRVVLADEATRSGDHDRAQSLMPSDEEIVEALKAARIQRATATTAKAEKASAKASASVLTVADVNSLFE